MNEEIERAKIQRGVTHFYTEHGTLSFDYKYTSKRNAEQHCRWLVLWLFKKKPDGESMNDGDIAELDRISDQQTVTDGRREIAKLIEIEYRERRGRPRRKKEA